MYFPPRPCLFLPRSNLKSAISNYRQPQPGWFSEELGTLSGDVDKLALDTIRIFL
jgi:hypothetical protein